MSNSWKSALFYKGKSMGLPISGTFELTKRCNLSCRMCYIHDGKSQGKELTANTWINLGKAAAGEGMLYLLLTGGEPLFRKDFSFIYRELIREGLRISINTNGSLITEEILRLWTEYPPEQVNVTLYGSSEDTYEKLCGNGKIFQSVLQNIARLKNAGISVAINTTFTRINYQDHEAIIQFAKDLKLPVRMANYLFPQAGHTAAGQISEEDQKLYLTPGELGRLCAGFERLSLSREVFEKKRSLIRSLREEAGEERAADEEAVTGSRCMAGCGAFWISWEGRMYPCGMLRDGEAVLETGFARAWESCREKAGLMSYPVRCLTCTKKKLCPFCQAVYYSLGKDMKQIQLHMCTRTDAYMEEYCCL